MAKKKKKKAPATHTTKQKVQKDNERQARQQTLNENYLWFMKESPAPGHSVNTFQLTTAAFFTAVIIMIVRLHSYFRDMSEFYWSSSDGNMTDFFSYFKVVFIIICTVLAVILLLYRLFVQSFYIKKSILYIPALVYVAFVLLSFAFSSDKDIAWMGWNDRFEGTLVLMCYIFMVFYIMNLVNSEKNVKAIIYPLTAVSFVLSLLGLSQALDKDFFRTTIGQKLIVPNSALESGSTAWQMIEEYAAKGEPFLQFTFQNREIYQTVYNINYVSFYLTLLIPIFGLLFIQEKESIVQKIIWGVMFALTVFNLIGSASSGGLLGMFIIVVLATVLFNKKILSWWKPLLILIIIAGLVAGVTYERWTPELTAAAKGVLGTTSESTTPAAGSGDTETAEVDSSKAGASGHKFDYFENEGNTIRLSLDGNIAVIDMEQDNAITVYDGEENVISAVQDQSTGVVTLDNENFSSLTITPTTDENGNYILSVGLTGEDKAWNFTKTDEGTFHVNDFGNNVKLENVPHWGFEDNPGFGSGRGYIWSRSLPMIKDTIFVGNGADTYCVYFPHKDYVGKYNAGWNVNMVVDKPHNMYMGIAINTGLISLLALLVFFGIYLVQSFRLYFRHEMKSFMSFTGAGIFLGICGFLVAGLVNDSSVSVMPMFYGLLGTGIAINMLIKRNIE